MSSSLIFPWGVVILFLLVGSRVASVVVDVSHAVQVVGFQVELRWAYRVRGHCNVGAAVCCQRGRLGRSFDCVRS